MNRSPSLHLGLPPVSSPLRWLLAMIALAIAAPPLSSPALAGVAQRACLWSVAQRRALRVRFLDGTPEMIAQVKAWAELWTQRADVRFVWADAGPAEIRVSFAGAGNHSAVGRCSGQDQSAPTMMLGVLNHEPNEIRRETTVLHELGHALGLEHEHQSPLADIEWDLERVYADSQRTGRSREFTEKFVLGRFPLGSVEASAYDADSVMSYVFPPSWGEGLRVMWRAGLSAGDSAFIARLYPSYEGVVDRTIAFEQEGWTLVSLADFDGDRRPDAWLRKRDDDRMFRAVRLEDGGVIKELRAMPGASFEGVFDVDGNGTAETLWRAEMGLDIDAVAMSEGSDKAWSLVGTSQSRRVLAVGDWDSDGLIDLLASAIGEAGGAWWFGVADGGYRRVGSAAPWFEGVVALQDVDRRGGIDAVSLDSTTWQVRTSSAPKGVRNSSSGLTWSFEVPAKAQLLGFARGVRRWRPGRGLRRPRARGSACVPAGRMPVTRSSRLRIRPTAPRRSRSRISMVTAISSS
jgi:hypothetical protein